MVSTREISFGLCLPCVLFSGRHLRYAFHCLRAGASVAFLDLSQNEALTETELVLQLVAQAFPNVQKFCLDNCRFETPFHSTTDLEVGLGALRSLGRGLTLAYNNIPGPLPPALFVGHHRQLTQLWLNSNQFTGSIPSEIGQLVSLQVCICHCFYCCCCAAVFAVTTAKGCIIQCA